MAVARQQYHILYLLGIHYTPFQCLEPSNRTSNKEVNLLYAKVLQKDADIAAKL